MKAKDLKVGEVYMVAREQNWRSRTVPYGLAKVVVLEAPVHPWAATWGGFRSASRGVDKLAPKNAALVEVTEMVRGAVEPYQDRIPLAHIRLPWEEWEAHRAEVQARREEREMRDAALEDEVGELNRRLHRAGVDIRLRRTSGGYVDLLVAGSDARTVARSILERFES